MNSQKKYDVFISYRHQDKEVVRELARRLQQKKIRVFFDEKCMGAGECLHEKLAEAIDSSGVFVACFSPSYANESYMKLEIDYAIGRKAETGLPVIPVVLPGVRRADQVAMPKFLRSTTTVEFNRSLDEPETFQRLERGIKLLCRDSVRQLSKSTPIDGVPTNSAASLDARVSASSEGICPYPGLRSFDIDESRLFFGRKALVGKLVQGLKTVLHENGRSRFWAITGASGSGKSSLVRAGLVAEIERGAIETSETWPIVVCRPGETPLESLATGLHRELVGKTLDMTAVTKLISDLQDNPRALLQSALVALGDRPASHRLVVVVDQFEELFTLCQDETQRKAFIDNVICASTDVQSRVVVVVAMRSDFIGDCARYYELATAIEGQLVFVTDMTEGDLAEVIEEPARLRNCLVEPGLIQMLVRDSREQRGGLAVLGVVLRQLWERRSENCLRVEDYLAIGRMDEVVARWAGDVYAKFSPSDQKLVRDVFLRLVQIDDASNSSSDLRCTGRRTEVAELSHRELSATGSVVARLVAERLVVASASNGADDKVEIGIAHESLIHSWPLLRGWIADVRDDLRFRQDINREAREWTRHNRDNSFLVLRGLRLDRALNVKQEARVELSESEQEYIDACQRDVRATMDREQRLVEEERSIESKSKKLIEKERTLESISKHLIERRKALMSLAFLTSVPTIAWILNSPTFKHWPVLTWLRGVLGWPEPRDPPDSGALRNSDPSLIDRRRDSP